MARVSPTGPAPTTITSWLGNGVLPDRRPYVASSRQRGKRTTTAGRKVATPHAPPPSSGEDTGGGEQATRRWLVSDHESRPLPGGIACVALPLPTSPEDGGGGARFNSNGLCPNLQAMSENPMRRASGTEGYGETADERVKQYESLAFADVHRDIVHLFPTTPSRVIDIGAGTGRDAAAFAELGHSVTAVEPTPELRAHAQRLHRQPGITWIDDALPDLDRVHALVHALGERYDLVMLTAVWMHLDQAERERAMGRVAPLVRPDGVMVLSLRHGPVPAGRRMFEVSAAETRALAACHGLATVHDSEHPSLLGGPAVWWSRLAFRAQR